MILRIVRAYQHSEIKPELRPHAIHGAIIVPVTIGVIAVAGTGFRAGESRVHNAARDHVRQVTSEAIEEDLAGIRDVAVTALHFLIG